MAGERTTWRAKPWVVECRDMILAPGEYAVWRAPGRPQLWSAADFERSYEEVGNV